MESGNPGDLLRRVLPVSGFMVMGWFSGSSVDSHLVWPMLSPIPDAEENGIIGFRIGNAAVAEESTCWQWQRYERPCSVRSELEVSETEQLGS